MKVLDINEKPESSEDWYWDAHWGRWRQVSDSINLGVSFGPEINTDDIVLIRHKPQ